MNPVLLDQKYDNFKLSGACKKFSSVWYMYA